ncbi:MAG: hypothetical protein RSF88_07915 [Lachnospiraceae bacterium]
MKKESMPTQRDFTVKSLELKLPIMNLIGEWGAQKILEYIGKSQLKEVLWLRNRKVLERDYYEKNVVEQLIFFPNREDTEHLERELKELLKQMQKEKIPIVLKEKEQILPIKIGKNTQIFLEIVIDKYCVPFFLELMPYKKLLAYPKKEIGIDIFSSKKELCYCQFPLEEYLAEGYYRILDRLELINDMSWYKEIYDVLRQESLEGRKVRDSFLRWIEEHPIPSMEDRIETLKGYRQYAYMKKKWKNESKRYADEFPKWEEVLDVMIVFIEPIVEAVTKDEIFFGDWMPQLGRYLS